MRIRCLKLFFSFFQLHVNHRPHDARWRLKNGEGLLPLTVTIALGPRQGSPVGRRSRLVDVDRELRATGHQQEPDVRLESREASMN